MELSAYSLLETCGAVGTFCWSLARFVSYFSSKANTFETFYVLIQKVDRVFWLSSLIKYVDLTLDKFFNLS